MKKIIIAFDGIQFSRGAFEFARQLNDLQPILLTGVFVPQLSYKNLWSYTEAMAGPIYVPIVDDEQAALLEKNVDTFQQLCIRENIAFRIHKDFYDFSLLELKKETRFADLLIISSEKFFEELGGNEPGEYLKDVIHESECPVVVIPEDFTFPGRNVIAYDGSASSVYALKQFAYLFPELSANETILVYSSEKEEPELPHEEYVEELATQHYKDLNILKLDIDPRKYFNEWLEKAEKPVLISGAFGRSPFSQLMKKSFVSKVIAEHKFPVFVAHR